MGRGYSGSTILDITLGNCADIESVGEFAAALGRVEREVCACGSTIADCAFWTEVRKQVEATKIDWLAFCRATNRSTRLSQLSDYFWQRDSSAPLRRFGGQTAEVMAGIAAAARKPHVLESSKSPVRGYFLLKFMPDTKAIHLVRDPRSVMRSTHWRLSQGDPLRFQDRNYRFQMKPLMLLVSALSWLGGSLIASAVAALYPSRVVTIRYEDLRDRPSEILHDVAMKLGFSGDDIDALLASSAELSVGHNIGGNRIRFEGNLRLDPNASSKRPQLPMWASMMTIIVCWPMMLKHGYLWQKKRSHPAETHELPPAEPTATTAPINLG